MIFSLEIVSVFFHFIVKLLTSEQAKNLVTSLSLLFQVVRVVTYLVALLKRSLLGNEKAGGLVMQLALAQASGKVVLCR